MRSPSFYSWTEARIPLPPDGDGEAIRWAKVPAFDLAPGRVVLLTGDSGVGKSHFLSHLAGVADIPKRLRSDKVVKGVLRDLPRPPGPYVWIPQSQPLRESLKVKTEVVTTWVALGVFTEEEAESKFTELANKLGMSPMAGKRISELSGGQRKRLTLLLRLPIPAKVLFLDEPEAGLDDGTFALILKSLFLLYRQPVEGEEDTRPAIVIVSHKKDKVAEVVAGTLGWSCNLVELSVLTGESINAAELPPQVKSGKSDSPDAGRGDAGRWLTRIEKQTANLFWHDCRSISFWGMHLLIPVVMVGMISICQTADAPLNWSKSFFFLLVTAMWVGVQGGLFIFNRHLPTWREDETWAKLAIPSADKYLRQFIRLTGTIGVLFFATVGAGIALLVGVACMLWIHKSPDHAWSDWQSPILGAGYGVGIMIIYGYAWGLTLSAIIAHIQMKWIRTRADSVLSTIAAPAIMLFHMLFSLTYLNGYFNAARNLASGELAKTITFYNPLVVTAHAVEAKSQLYASFPNFRFWQNGHELYLPYFIPLLLPLMLYISSYNATRAKDLRS